MSSSVTAAARARSRVLLGRLAVLQVAGFAVAVVLVALTAGSYRWSAWPLVIIGAFTIASDLTYVQTASPRLRVSGSGLGLVLAAVLLGAGPGAAVGVLSIAVGWFHSREALHYLRNNLVTFAWSPLAAGLFFHAAVGLFGVGPRAVGYYLLVFGAYLVSLAVNFTAVAGYACYLNRESFLVKARETLAPLFSAQLLSAVLAMGAVYLALQLGTVGLGLLGLMFVVFQYIVGQLLISQDRSRELERLVSTDELTGLANRKRFHDAVEQRIAAGDQFVVMLVDLDRFKEINDTLGHHYGDLVLRDLGPRLDSAIGAEGLVARLGGDEFALLPASSVRTATAIEQACAWLTSAISAPFTVQGLVLEVGASIGVSTFPNDGADSHALLRCADIAMYTAKTAQLDHKIYEAEQDHHSIRRLSLLSDIRRALASDEIVVHFQPIIDLSDRTVIGAESLARWQHPQHGLIPPAGFVQTVEQTGLIGPFTHHILERSIAECAAWRKAGRQLSVAVNLSTRNLLDRDLPAEIERLLASYSLPATALQLEITESMIMSDPERAALIVSRLSALGVGISVDDFGTGYSSLANLRGLQIDELKIDRSFVSPMLRQESDLIIVRSTINLGHDLGLRVIAEGVEDPATLEELAALGCDQAQGYHLSRPMPIDTFNRWLAHEQQPLRQASDTGR